MENRKIYKCFISSPGDCNEERKACVEILDKINNSLARHLDLQFEPFMWEYDVLPDMGTNGQQIIDEYIIKSNYDIFIGIMKNRFGTPTKKAGSGTEHEFIDALDRKKRSHDNLPKILFYFGKEMVDPATFDKAQFDQVQHFKKSIQNNGLYIDYEGTEQFCNSLEKMLNLFVADLSPLENSKEKIKNVDSVLCRLEKDLKECLKVYNEDSPVWIEPVISSKREIPTTPNKNNDYKIEIKSLIDTPTNIIIKAPSEFGLTSLAHYLKLEAWKSGKTFLYIDVHQIRKHKAVKDIINESETYYDKNIDEVECILLDSVCFQETGIMKMIKLVSEHFLNTPIIIFNTQDNNFFLKSDEEDNVTIKREFASYYLLPLPQNDLRKIVSTYVNIKPFEEDYELVLNKVTKDLEVLNMHRTVKNCVSILRAGSSIGNEYSIVNRTKLLESILSAIFRDYNLPTYHDEKPDVKECSFVLGYLCELLVFKNNFEFSDDFFRIELGKFCEEKNFDLDLNYLLSVLKDNSIIGTTSGKINYFKNTYWVFYFIAQRMNMNNQFREFVYENRKYIDYPEIIEFYTGIDRNKEDALKILNKDILETLQTVRSKVQISDDLNPYKSIKWNPDVETLEREVEKISENVISSGLPDEVKDKYDDKNYDQTRPYRQIINSVFKEYSFQVLMRQISATSRALRNSDFVNDDQLKKDVFGNLMKGWNEISKLLIILTPLLAEKGNASFEGASFHLNEEDFNSITDPYERMQAVLLSVPTNVVRMFKDDLFSKRMGSLLIEMAEKENNSLIKHELMILILAERPKKWRETIDQYIINLDKNSYFLSDILSVIDFNIEYKATEIEDVRILKLLSKKCRAKHIFNSSNPNGGLIKRLDKIEKGGQY